MCRSILYKSEHLHTIGNLIRALKLNLALQEEKKAIYLATSNNLPAVTSSLNLQSTVKRIKPLERLTRVDSLGLSRPLKSRVACCVVSSSQLKEDRSNAAFIVYKQRVLVPFERCLPIRGTYPLLCYLHTSPNVPVRISRSHLSLVIRVRGGEDVQVAAAAYYSYFISACDWAARDV
jgi:hypothetical protein